MLPGVKPAKSVASQPLVEPPVDGKLRSTAWTAAVTSPLPEWSIVRKSTPFMYVTLPGVVWSRVDGVSSLKNGNSNS